MQASFGQPFSSPGGITAPLLDVVQQGVLLRTRFTIQDTQFTGLQSPRGLEIFAGVMGKKLAQVELGDALWVVVEKLSADTVRVLMEFRPRKSLPAEDLVAQFARLYSASALSFLQVLESGVQRGGVGEQGLWAAMRDAFRKARA